MDALRIKMANENAYANLGNVGRDSLVHEGDHVKVSLIVGRTSKVINTTNTSDMGISTSFGESINPSLSMMNPSGDYDTAVVDEFWSNNHDINRNSGGASTVPNPTGWNMGDQSSSMQTTGKPAIVKLVDINAIPNSYVGVAGASTKAQTNVESNFCSLVADKVFDSVNISTPRKVVKKAGLDAVLEGGPWMIRNSSIILKKWSINTSLQKEEMTCILIWDKLHDVPIQVFKEDGISLIATYLGKPIMLDSYTSSMYKESWGPGHTKETIRVEYEWKPPRCPTCNIFGHTGETCPNKVVTNLVMNDTKVTNDGFQKAVNRKCNNKGSSAGNKLPKGVSVSNGFQVGKDFAFKPKASNVCSNGDNGTRGETNPRACPSKNINEGALLNVMGTNVRQQDTGKKKISNIASPNPFAALVVDDDEEEEVENIWDESENLNFHDTGICAILECHVDVATVYDTCKKVNTRADHKTLFCSFVYADNYYIDRRVLWSNLIGHAGLMRSRSWVLLGNFNDAFNLEDHLAGSYESNAAMHEFEVCPSYGGGCAMFRVVKRLKGLKSLFRKLLHNHGNLHARVNKVRIKLDEAQKAINRDSSSSILREEHARHLLDFKEAQLDEERFLKHKAKIEWLKAGDSNTAYFHKIVLGAFVTHYNQFLGTEGVTNPLDDHDLFTCVLDKAKANFMVCDVSNDEVKSVIFSMGV
ncbi:RNA-directed DNA polymerase, eukaryota, reverse transcriptase zinc-binding domain protein [Tanacetum coccineum]